MVRTLTGHRSSCSAVEFHPFGEFFASGSMDTNLKIWDIRKKGCIHTYKGHTQGISTIKFTPDGRWVVSGGFDNVVKVTYLSLYSPGGFDTISQWLSVAYFSMTIIILSCHCYVGVGSNCWEALA